MKGWIPAPVFLLLFFCILCAGCLSPVYDGWIDDWEDPVASACDSPAAAIGESAGIVDQDHCYQELAVMTGDLPICDRIGRDPPKTKCYLRIAARVNDPLICRQVPPSADPQAYLRIDCLWEVAMKNNNRAACEYMGDERISRMFIGEMSRESCLRRIESGQGATGGLT